LTFQSFNYVINRTWYSNSPREREREREIKYQTAETDPKSNRNLAEKGNINVPPNTHT